MAIIQGNAKQGSTRGFYPKIINGSLRFNDDDSAYLSWTPASAGNRKTWTWSGWVKRGNLGAFTRFFTAKETTSNGESVGLRFDSSDRLDFIFIQDGSSSITGRLITTQVFRDVSAWYHIVFVQDTTASDGDKMRLWVNGSEVTQFDTETNMTTNHDGYINKTVEHRVGAESHATSQTFDGYLANVHFIDGQALTPSDFGETKNGVWVAKDYAGTFGTNGFYLTFEDDTEVEAFNTVTWPSQGGDPAYVSITGTGFTPDLVWVKNRSSAQSHLLYDSVRGAGSEKELISDLTYYEGQGNAESYGYLSSFDNDGFTFTRGSSGWINANYSTDKWVAWCWDAGANNAVTGHSSVTYTGNGTDNHRISGLPFTPDLIWGKKRSAAGSHFLLDSVRGVNSTLSSDTTGAEDTTADIFRGFDKDGFILGSNGQSNSSGVTYIAWAWDAGDGDPVSNTAGSITSTVKASQANGFSIVSYTGDANASKTIGHGLSTAPDMIIVKGRNVAQNWVVYHSANTGSPETQRLYLDGTNATDTVAWWNNTAPTSSVFSVSNFGGTGGAYNYIAYCFHDVTGKQKFGTYTGTGASGNSVTTGFRPGWVMIKATSGANNWIIYDGSRDPLNPCTASLCADSSAAENGVSTASENLVEFTDNGFTLTTTNALTNASSVDYIYAAFAGSYSDYITDYNTDGTNIDSRVKANQTTGFSIVSYEGSGTASDSFGHGLGTAPSMVIIKDRQLANSWLVQHSSVTGYLTLNSTNAVAGTDQLTFGASTVTLNGTWDIMNGSGRPYIAYCWSETTGYSKFGSYTGTGSNQTINFGFKPAFLLLKVTDAGDPWIILDGTRETVNDRNFVLQPNSSAVEDTDNDDVVEFTDTGVIIKSTSGWSNRNGFNYIYAAFADTREAAFWLDQSGNDNDWQPVNLDHNDTLLDSPTNNFATMNPLAKGPNNTLSDGNLQVLHGGTGGWQQCQSTFAFPNSGKWYCEFTIVYQGDATDRVGINVSKVGYGPINTSTNLSGGNNANIWTYFAHTGSFYHNGVSSGSASTFGTGDVIQVCFDSDTGSLYFGKNGVWQNSGNPTAGTGYAYTGLSDVAVGTEGYSNAKVLANFGQQPFKYDPPA